MALWFPPARQHQSVTLDQQLFLSSHVLQSTNANDHYHTQAGLKNKKNKKRTGGICHHGLLRSVRMTRSTHLIIKDFSATYAHSARSAFLRFIHIFHFPFGAGESAVSLCAVVKMVCLIPLVLSLSPPWSVMQNAKEPWRTTQ